MSDTLPQFVRDLVASMPRRGNGLHIALFQRARYLLAFRTHNETVEILKAATYGEPISPPSEIEDAVTNAAKVVWIPPGQSGNQPAQIPRPTWPKTNERQRKQITERGGGLYDFWGISPVRFEDDTVHTEDIIDALFPGNPLLCCGKSDSSFDTHPRDEWRGKLSALQLIVPNPMTARRGETKKGTQSAHALSITGARRFLVVEFDHGTADDHAALLLHLAAKAPLALAVYSGSKSLHGWFARQNHDDEQLKRFMRYAVSLGACHSTWSRSQFVRMPDGLRKGKLREDGTREKDKRQVVYYFNPEVLR